MIKDFETLFKKKLVSEQEVPTFSQRSRLDRNSEREAFSDARDTETDPEEFDSEGLSINVDDQNAQLILRYLEHVNEIEEMIDRLIDVRKTSDSGEPLLVTVASEDRLDSISRGLAAKIANPLKKAANQLSEVKHELLIVAGREPELKRHLASL